MSGQTVIAIIDENPAVREAIGGLLRAYGFHPKYSFSVEAFLAQDNAEQPTCLIFDAKPGGLSGSELQRRLKAKGSELPVIVISTVNNEIAEARAIGAGCLSYLHKPFSAESLICSIIEATR
jgi:FixJ family two-component response regulator